mgnify:CR=1 FL=1
MKTSTVHAGSREHYFVPQPSLYPVILSGGMFLLALGFIQAMNSFPLGKWVMLGGFMVILYVLFGWFGRVISESQGGSYRDWEDRSFRYGMIWFIATEVMFFAAFFGALFYMRVISVPDLGGMLDAHGTSPGNYGIHQRGLDAAQTDGVATGAAGTAFGRVHARLIAAHRVFLRRGFGDSGGGIAAGAAFGRGAAFAGVDQHQGCHDSPFIYAPFSASGLRFMASI